MGDHLNRAMALVAHDIVVMGAPLPVVEDSDWQDWPTAESALLRSADGSGMGVWVDTASSMADQVAALADQVQDWVVELADKRMTTWPQCPDHPANHPMLAVAENDCAMWVCPASRRQVSEIGQLTSSAT